MCLCCQFSLQNLYILILIFNEYCVWFKTSFLYFALSLINGFKCLLRSLISFFISRNVSNDALHSILISNVGFCASNSSADISVVVSITSFYICFSLIKFLNCTSVSFAISKFSYLLDREINVTIWQLG